MQIKSNRAASLANEPSRRSGRFLRLCAAVAVYTLIVLAGGMYVHARVNLRELFQKVREIPKAVYAHTTSSMRAAPDVITISIKLKNYEKLAQQRRTALANKILLANDDDFVAATIVHEGVSIPVSLRLKGDIVRDHVGDARKWSFRIRTKGENTLYGMKQFSLHHPKARNYIFEWIYHQALRREDILALRYKFIRVILNREDLGIYALEEHFEKRLIEYGKRREGPIVHFNEGAAWEEIARQPFADAKANGVGSYLVTEIDSAQSKQWTATPEQRDIHDRAISMLEAFRRGEMSTSDVFDVDHMAMFFAISDLLGAQHGTEWKNIRFYFNPITTRLEPIGFDGNGFLASEGLCYMLKDRQGFAWWRVLMAGDYYQQLFKDSAFFEKYLEKLDYVSRPEYLDKLLADIDDELRQNLDIIRIEVPRYEYSPEVLYNNQRYIRSVINPVRGIIGYFQHSADGQLTMQLGNPHYLPTTIIDATCEKQKLDAVTKSLTIPGKVDGTVIAYQPLSFKLPQGFEWKDEKLAELRVHYKVAGTSQIREAAVALWPYLDVEKLEMGLTRKPANTDEFEFIARDEPRKRLIIKPGEWTISKDLIFPAEYTVRCDAGTTLNLEQSAAILSYSPLEFSGSEEQPIVIRSNDGTGQGLVVIKARRRSVLDHVTFLKLTNPVRPGWNLTGAVTFYESPVVISHCNFLENSCEDSLNTVRSTFLITDCYFSLTQGDAFDADFCQESRIENSTFSKTGNDCIDVSGSSVEIANIQIDKPGDKGLSIGEHSTANVKDVTVKGARIGMAIKDLSQATVNGLNLSNCQYGIAALQKKPEFGPGKGTFRNLKMESVGEPYILEAGSEIRVDGELIPPDRENLRAELYKGL